MNYLAYADGIITAEEALGISLKGIIIVMLILGLLAVTVVILSKIIRLVQKDDKVQPQSVPAAPPVKRPSPKADESQGSVDLTGTDEKTAAVIMAIVSKESKIPLERLKFNSIKLIESEDDTK